MTLLEEIERKTLAANVLLRENVSSLEHEPYLPVDVWSRFQRIANGPLKLIAEMKRKSPSAGMLSTAMTLEERIICYVREGAAMVSVLVDQDYFDGSFDDLRRARRTVRSLDASIPILCKGFILEEIQLRYARACGADAVLLIARCLPGERLETLSAHAESLRLTPIFEVTNSLELERIRSFREQRQTIIGVNARDLDTLAMDRERASALVQGAREHEAMLYFSGLANAEQVARISKLRVCGALIGEALMRQDDPSVLLRTLIHAAS